MLKGIDNFIVIKIHSFIVVFNQTNDYFIKKCNF
jgi:hypothetical protein